MNTQQDAATIVLTGQLAMVLMIAVPLAFLLSMLLLRIYLHAVKRSMMRHSGSVAAQAPVEIEQAAPAPPPVALEIMEVGAATGASPVRDALAQGALAARWRAATVYAIAGAVCALILASVYLGANGMEFLPRRVAFMAASYGWPVVLTVGIVATISRREWLAVAAIYFLSLAVLVAPSINEKLGWDQVILYWALVNVPPTLIVLGFLTKRIRAVGPMVLAFMVAAVGGATINVNLLGNDPERLRWVIRIGSALGLDGLQTFYATMLIGVLIVGAIGWLMLLWLGVLYRARRISDQSIIVDSIWFMFAIQAGMSFVFAGPWWFLAAIGAFAVYKLFALLGFAILRRFHAGDERAPRLLLLRVFSLGKRSARLFDSVGKLWRYSGSIHMITGPDLATSTVEPHEFLDFLTGRLARRFITASTFARRLGEAESRRDFDGRFRVNDFFCHDDTWKLVLGHLARISEVILMDLRGFTPQHQGCVYEIQELLNAVPLERVLFVIDGTTDEPFLQATFAQCWASVRPQSPNLHNAAPRVRLFRLTGKGEGSVPSLVRQVVAAANAHGAALPA